MNYSLKNCTINDCNLILELKNLGMKWYIEKLYGWDYEIQRERTLQEINDNLDNMKIIVVNGHDIGVTTFSEYDNYFEVGLLIVHPDYQNNGIASSILNKYIEIARFNKKRIIIKTYKENPAQKLYKRLGFEIYKTDTTHIYLDINFK